MQQAADYDRSNLESAILAALPDVVTEKQAMPEDLAASYDALVMRSLNSIAGSYGVDAETLVAYYGISIDEYIEMYSHPQLINDAAIYAIAAENGLLPDEAEYKEMLSKYMEEYGITDESVLFEDLSEAQYRVYFLEEKIMDFLCEQYMK